MNPYFVNLNFPFDFLNPLALDLLDKLVINPDTIVFQDDVKKYVSEDLLNFLKEKDIVCHAVILAYNKTMSPIHIDDYSMDDQMNLNFTIGGYDSEVIWYKPKDGYNGHRNYNTAGATVKRFLPENMEEVHRQSVNGAGLFQCGIPHNVINPLDRRYTVIVKLRKQGYPNIPIKFSEALEIFKEYIGR